MSIRIIADSTCYLPKEYIDKYNVSIVSLNVLLNGKSYRETDLENDWFYKEMSKSPSIPTSSQPSIDDFYKAIESQVKEGHDIVGIFLSSDMSGTFSTSNLVKEMILEKYAKSVIENSKFIFVPDTLDYLKKGGRIGGAAALFGSLLQIKPILTVTDGKTTVLTKVRTKKKAIDKIIDTVMEQNLKSPIKGLIVHHINCESEGQELANKLQDKLGISNIKIQSIGPIIGLHVGPGSIGVAYHY